MKQILLLLLLCVSGTIGAQNIASLKQLAAELDDAPYSTGIQIYDLTADQMLWSYHDQKIMRPASCQKLLTTITALDVLGSQYELSTTVSVSGNIVSINYADTLPDFTYLDGNVYVKGGFDPTLTYEDVLQMVSAIKAIGIDSITGNIYADTNFKDQLLLGSGWCWDDEPSAFTPYLSPLIFDRGKLTPELDEYPTDPMFNPAKHFVRTLATQLYLQGIPCGGYALDVTPANTQVIYEKRILLTELLPRILKNSDNLYAEALFYQIAHNAVGDGATWKDGSKVVNSVVKKAGANLLTCKINDGCGLSPYDFLTPSTLVSMLRYAYSNKDIYDNLLPNLPISGEDGTLERRMTRRPALQKVFAKTGTVTGVSSLAGYVTASNGHTLAFAIICNGLLRNATGHNIQDRICTILAR